MSRFVNDDITKILELTQKTANNKLRINFKKHL